jgi:iron complex outermembrane receptor protein
MHQRTKIALAVAMALHSLTAFAQAQAEAEAPQRVEVTGSRIRQVDLETAQPVFKMTSQQIQATGLVNIGDVLNQMTGMAPPSFSKGATLTSNAEQGGQYIDMRNLGANRLLVLVDGKRWTQSVDGYTDISTVPTSMVERIEILKDGASSIYGSDAIAGVVNIILKKTMVGGSFSAYTGQNAKGDGETNDYNFAYGAGDEKASLMFGLSHSNTAPVWARDRTITSFPRGPNNPTAGLGVGPWGNITALDGSFDRVLNHTGGPNGVGVGADARNPANYHDYDGRADDNFNSASQMMFQSPTKLTTAFTKGEIALPWDLRFKSTAMYSERKSSRQIAGYPLNSTSQADYPVYIDKDSYFNPYGSSVAGAGNGQDLIFYRRTIELPRITENNSQTFHVDAAIEGDFNLRGLPWNWSVAYNHNRVNGTQKSTGNINLLNLKKALGPSFLNASGQVQCGTAANPIALNACTPFNIIGGPSASTPEALAYVNSTGLSTYGSTINSATADLSGELFKLPAGSVGVAGGLEHRTVRGFDQPGLFEQSGYSTDLASNATYGNYSVREAYLEANIPVLKDVFLAKYLSIDLASRYSDYSNFGSTTNSKVSLMWKPVNDLLVRGTWAEGFRAPSLGDTFGGGSQSFVDYMDICDSVNGDAATNATVRANCARVVPAGYRQLNQSGNPVDGSGGQSNVAFRQGAGNNALQPETAKTKTIGLVYSPSFVPGLTATIDWFNIQVNNKITAIDAEYVLKQCYENNVQSFCGQLQRNASGEIVNMSLGNANLGKLETEGVDFGFNYRLPRSSYGNFTLRSDSTWVKTYRIQSEEGAKWDEYNGEYLYNRLKSNLSLDWALGNWNATFTSRYVSGTKDGCFSPTVSCSNPGGGATFGNYNKIGSLTYSDLSVGYKTPWKGQITVGANNVFDKEPRIVRRGQASSSVVDPDVPIDRFVYVRYNQSF